MLELKEIELTRGTCSALMPRSSHISLYTHGKDYTVWEWVVFATDQLVFPSDGDERGYTGMDRYSILFDKDGVADEFFVNYCLYKLPSSIEHLIDLIEKLSGPKMRDCSMWARTEQMIKVASIDRFLRKKLGRPIHLEGNDLYEQAVTNSFSVGNGNRVTIQTSLRTGLSVVKYKDKEVLFGKANGKFGRRLNRSELESFLENMDVDFPDG